MSDVAASPNVEMDLLTRLQVYAPDLMAGFLVGVAGWFVAKFVKSLLLKAGGKLKWDDAVAVYLANSLRIVTFIMFLVSALDLIGVPVDSLLATIGVSGLIIGLGLRAELSNYFAGVVMLFSRPFKAGDLIEFGPPFQIAHVREVRLMYTRMDTLDNVQIVLPNAILWKNRIFNFSRHGRRAIRLKMSFSYDTSKQWVRAICLDVLEKQPFVLNDPKPTFSVSDVMSEQIQATVVAWTGVDTLNLFEELLTVLKKEFNIAGLEVKVPSQDIDLKREE